MATSTSDSTTKNKELSVASLLFQAILGAGLLQLLYRACLEAYDIRLYAIKEFGRIIHEFDPYFNYRATVYLYDHGWKAFSHWFDYMVWYPLGRPVGTTIYPGMQVTSVLIKEFWLKDWSINDICCFVPVWFGVTATLAVAWMTYEATRTNRTSVCVLQPLPIVGTIYSYTIKPLVTHVLEQYLEPLVGGKSALGLRLATKVERDVWWTPVCCAVASALIMSVLPAHLLRSIGGGYDNESIAMTAMVVTFACWMTSLRDSSPDDKNALLKTTWCGVATGFAYFYMVAAWGGYVFVLNLVGVHAGILVLLGRYSTKLHRAYTGFFIVGTTLATQVPVVRWTPLRSLEQMGPLLVFGGMQLIEYCEVMKRRRKLTTKETWKLRIRVFTLCAVVAACVAYILVYLGYFGPISSRVRGLFVKHTKTGNPLVDSVAEHQAASKEAYFQYLRNVCYLLPAGMCFLLVTGWNDASSFLAVFAAMAYFFSLKMVRLILLTAPIASAVGGIAIGKVVSWGVISALLIWEDGPGPTTQSEASKKSTNAARRAATKMKKSTSTANEDSGAAKDEDGKTERTSLKIVSVVFRGVRLVLTAGLLLYVEPYAEDFYRVSHDMAMAISHPTIIQKAQTRSGEEVVVDDYREAYHWLRDNTPEDARVMAWWDYGYQITGIGNRTTIADGNTWNHEHIALLGRILTGPEKEAHRIARHLADYVLVWAGGGGDDLAKSPHLRRIANSVYRGLCREPTCRDFGFKADRSPTESLRGSLLFILHSNQLVPGVEADRNRFKEVFKTKYGKVRIYKILSVSKESKEWVENNRLCDAPGSWYCPGQYPPALQKILREKRDFAQLEDFNRGKADEEYTKEYFKNLDKKGPAAEPQKTKLKKLPEAEAELINDVWENTETTTTLWELISQDRISELRDLFVQNPSAPHTRSEDGRGPMWWAHEFGRTKIIELLKRLGVSESRRDGNGLTPLDVSKKA